MANNQPTSAVIVIPDDSINIPNPGIIISGTNTGAGTTLTDVGKGFTNAETTLDYMAITREYIMQYGKPTAFYSDKHSVFKVNNRDAKTAKITQFGRALKDLNIELLCANSSQAKGRVERANKTLQDRLIKEMRLEGINNIAEANVWLPKFIGVLCPSMAFG